MMNTTEKAFAVLFTLGLILAIPLGFDDLANVILGKAISDQTGLPWVQAFLLTYVIGILLVLCVWILLPSASRGKFKRKMKGFL